MESSIAQTVSAISFHSWKDKKTQTRMWIDKFQSVMMAWIKVSRWKKSAKWKRLIKQFQSHLIVQRNRRECIMRQSSVDIAQLLQTDQLQKALDRVKQLYKDKCLLAAYDQIEHFCECIATNLPLIISKQSALEALPSDVSQAVSSLVFAASRCGELPELNLMRILLTKRFGCKFEEANVKLFKENLVNPKMKQNLCIGSIPDDVKLKLIKEIAEEHNLQLGFQDFEHNISPQCQKVYRLSDAKLKSGQEAGVANMEIQESFNGYDDNKIQTSPPKASEKRAPIDYGTIPGNSQTVKNTTNGSSSCNQAKKNEVQMERLEAISLALSSTPISLIEPRQYHSLPRLNQWSQNKRKDLIKDRRSFDSSIQKLKEQSHVHPKLPEYEEVHAKLTELKMKYKQRQSVSNSKAFR